MIEWTSRADRTGANPRDLGPREWVRIPILSQLLPLRRTVSTTGEREYEDGEAEDRE
jgi:hypothetical protein